MKQRAGIIVLCLFEILIGILLLINPIGFASGIIIVCGVVLLLSGIIFIIRYFRSDAAEAAVKQMLFKGLIALLAGALCSFKSRWLVATFPLLTIVYGVAILVVGLRKIQWTADIIRMKERKWLPLAISAAVSILCAVIILIRPFTTTAVLWMFTGIALIAEAIFDLFVSFIEKRG